MNGKRAIREIFNEEMEDDPDKDNIDLKEIYSSTYNAMSKRRHITKKQTTSEENIEIPEKRPEPVDFCQITGLRSGSALYKSIDNYIYTHERNKGNF